MIEDCDLVRYVENLVPQDFRPEESITIVLARAAASATTAGRRPTRQLVDYYHGGKT
jgi:hypothetical protein